MCIRDRDYTMHSMDFEEFLWAKGYDSAFIERLYEKMVSITPLSNIDVYKRQHQYNHIGSEIGKRMDGIRYHSCRMSENTCSKLRHEQHHIDDASRYRHLIYFLYSCLLYTSHRTEPEYFRRVTETIPGKDAIAISQQQAVNTQIATNRKASILIAIMLIGKVNLVRSIIYL